MNKSKRMRWVEMYVACMGATRNAYNIVIRNFKVMGNLGGMGVDRKIEMILKERR
jgi:hypothetical protein